MKKSVSKSLWFLCFLPVICAWVCGLFIDLTGDSGLYATISRQMVESGNWLELKINGEPYNQKPHLFFWLAGAGIKLFGNFNFAFKLFPFLFGLLSLYFVYRFGKFIHSENSGKLAALITGTSQMFFLYFLDIHTDTVLQTGVILALWQLAVYLKKGNLYNLLFGFFGIGLAMLTKGPVGAVLPLFFVVLYLVIIKKPKQLFNYKWFIGILIVCVMILPSLFHLWKHFGWEGLYFYFINNNLGRITGKVAGSKNDIFYYSYNMLWAFLPWTVLVIAGFIMEIKSWIKRSGVIISRASLAGSALILFFIFSIAKGRAPNYFMVLLPPIAVVASGWITDIFNGTKRISTKLRVIFEISLLLVLTFLLVVVFILSTDLIYPVILTVISFFVVYIYKQKRVYSLERVTLVALFITGIFNLYLNISIIPFLYSYQGSRKVLNIFETNKKDGDTLYNFELEHYELFFYAREHVVNIKEWSELHSVMESPGTWLYTNEIKYDNIKNMNYHFEEIYEIRYRGMNRITLPFLNPLTREESLNVNYLIKTK